MSTLQLCQIRLCVLYRSRVRKLLQNARDARAGGDEAAARKLAGDACYWRTAAHGWAVKARTPEQAQVEHMRRPVGDSRHA